MIDAALLAAVLDDPDNNDLRLVLADWLEEHDEADRAELIRVQMELSRPGLERDRYGFLQSRERQLLATHAKSWFEDLEVAHRFKRGFLESIHCGSPAQFLSIADRLFERQPVQSVWLDTYEDVWDLETTEKLAASPHLARIRKLRISSVDPYIVPNEALLTLTASPFLTNLRSINLSDSGRHSPIDDTLFMELIGCGKRPIPPCFQKLQALGLHYSRLGDDSLRNLLASPLAKTLTAIDLLQSTITSSASTVTPSGIEALVRSPLWGRLIEADLSFFGVYESVIGTHIIDVLKNSGMKRLQTHLSGVELAATDSWGQLEALRISTRDGTEGTLAIAKSSHLSQLRRLELWYAATDEDLIALASNPQAVHLEHLEFELEGEVSEGVTALANSPHLTALCHLELKNLTVIDLKGLLLSPLAQQIRYLFLSGPAIRNEEVRLLAETAPLQNLTTLIVLLSEELSTESLGTLLASSCLPRLSCLYINHASKIMMPSKPKTLEQKRMLLEVRHIAWPGISKGESRSEELAGLYTERFGEFGSFRHLDWEEPLFSMLLHGPLAEWYL
jgi:uncharacterized protein (TIGR02996 family)